MLKNLKRKFIVTNMLLVGIVLLVVFVSFCVSMYNNQMREIDRTLSTPISKAISENGEFGYMTSMVVVIDSNNRISQTYVRGAVLEENQLYYAINKAMVSESSKGEIKKLSLFYQKSDFINGESVITFVDSSRFYEIMNRTIIMGIFVIGIAMIIVYFISRFIAGIAITPVQKSWEQQKIFIADASHELKTPLTVILANNEILKAKRDATIGEETQWIDSTITEAKHMKKLVEDMLFLAKHDSSEIKCVTENVNLSELAEENVLQFEPVAYEAGVELVSDIEQGIELVADKKQMRQLLHILIDNGIKYAASVDEGTPAQISIKIAKGMKKEIIVKNTCEILSKTQQQHIFDRFYKGDGARTKIQAGEGYGLGLAIAKSIAENHGGNIYVKSDNTAGPNGLPGVEFKVVI